MHLDYQQSNIAAIQYNLAALPPNEQLLSNFIGNSLRTR
jgi:hypothetical protein